ncbi:sigma-54 interaction domain-containing protein [Youngiibacter multivorans]|uniref:PAS domain S-box-containing protein n=1 Tax=Youngiibacter multivorans TaxID=937251 RepID=A0ABS4G7Y3_9CLOT|nr:sigma 54-interacting transcriptional regulator [Youngiibacter multivorans]MBP1920659.1 PAS domain S-box-containing protein [Youngiibacter multivorans]
MKVSDFLNRVSVLEKTGTALTGDTNIQDIRGDLLDTDESLLSVLDENGVKQGEVDTINIRYLVSKYSELPAIELLDHFREGLVIIDENGRICYINDAYKQILGVLARKVVGKFIFDIEGSALLYEVLKSGKPMIQEKHLVKSINKYVSLRMCPLYKGSKIIGAFSIFTDITEIDNLNNEVKRYSGIVDEYHREKEVESEALRAQIIGNSPNFLRILDQAVIVAKTDAAVLVSGANGSGKEVITKLIHMSSARRSKPFITVNCSAIPESLIESELFGYEEGAFTGSRKGGQMGKFELANKGTIFLDEIGDMPLQMQAKLLRVLERGEIEKIGRQKNVEVDVRVIAATNQPLPELIKQKKFREDLYYRLNVVNLTVPSLKDRGNDVILLANHFADYFCEKYSKKLSISDEAYRALARYSWPGNVRELQNSIEHAVILCSGPIIMREHLPGRIMEGEISEPDVSLSAPITQCEDVDYARSIAKAEKQLMLEALKRSSGSRTKAMELLGLSRRTFYRKLKENGLVP